MGPDPDFQINWSSSSSSNNATTFCGGGTGKKKSSLNVFITLVIIYVIGMAFRFCDSAGNWETPIVTNCLSFEYAALMQQVIATHNTIHVIREGSVWVM